MSDVSRKQMQEIWTFLDNMALTLHDNRLHNYSLLVQECYEELVETSRKRYALEAELDLVMMEYCPEEMTEEQWQRWGYHQVPVSDELMEKVKGAMENV